MKDVVFFFLKEAHFCLYSLEVTSRCASRGTHGEVDLYVRQLRDMKLSEEIALLTKKQFDRYARLCAMALARAHARSGDPAQISGYLGNSDAFAQALALFAESYADQTKRDHAALLAAIKEGRIQAVVDV